MKTAILAVFVATVVLAQSKLDVQLPANTRMYEPKNLTGDKAVQLAQSLRNLLGVGINWDGTLHAFVLKGNQQEMDTAETLLKRFDVAAPKVELTVYFVRATTNTPAPDLTGMTPPEAKLREQLAQQEERRREQSHPTTPVPPDLKSAIDEMKGTLNYDRYSLWDSVVLRVSDDGGDEEGAIIGDAGTYTYSLSYRSTLGSPISDTKTVNLTNFQFSLKMPVLGRPRAAATNVVEPAESHIRTDLTIPEGKKVVLGKIHLLPAGSGDLFLVLATRFD